MSRKNKRGYYDITAPADCDTPSKVADLLYKVDVAKLQASSDEGILRLRIAAPDPRWGAHPIFNVISDGFRPAGLTHGGFGRNEASVSTQRKGMGEAVLVCSTDLVNVLSKLRVGLRQQGEAFNM